MNVKCFLVEMTDRYTIPDGNGTSYQIFKRVDTGEEIHGRFPVGAMWFYKGDGYPLGPDGQSLFVQTPGGTWMVDGKCSNCTLPDDDVHRCWVRHGQAPNITVDKSGNTCQTGAGSIMIGNYHGFLRNGELTDC